MNLTLGAQRIHQLAKHRGISVNKLLVSELGLSKSVVDTMVKGSEPSAAKMNAIARYFGVPVDYILGEDDDPNYELIPADPEKVKELEAQQEAIFQERRNKLAEILKETDHEYDQPPRDNYEDMARRIKKLPRESQIRVLDYIELLENQDKG